MDINLSTDWYTQDLCVDAVTTLFCRVVIHLKGFAQRLFYELFFQFHLIVQLNVYFCNAASTTHFLATWGRTGLSAWGLLVYHAIKSTTSPNGRSFGVFGLTLYTVRSFGLGSFGLSWLLAFGLLASELVNQSPLPKLACLVLEARNVRNYNTTL